MTTNFNQNSTDIDQYLIPISNKDIVPVDERKVGTLWGSWGSLWTWGYNNSGRLGLNNTTDRSSPVQVGTLTNWSSVSAGDTYTAAIKNDGTLWTWGQNLFGKLGLNNTTDRSSPVQVGSLTNWSKVAGSRSFHYTVAIKTDGTLWTWGRNHAGQLGLNDTTEYSSPVQVGTLTNWSLVSCGSDHTVAIKTDGTLWTWGYNQYGQLGLGDTIDRSSPVQVGTSTNWSKLMRTGATQRSAAIKTDGTLWTWGRNIYGQLGHNDTTHRSSPTQVGTLTNWSLVASGNYYTSAIKTDGTLWTWGRNPYGQLGLGDTTSNSSPVKVGALTDWSSVSSGEGHTVTIKTDGTLWTWGYNNVGQLGLNNTTNSSSPVQVGTVTNWSLVFCGSLHSQAIQTG